MDQAEPEKGFTKTEIVVIGEEFPQWFVDYVRDLVLEYRSISFGPISWSAN